jgi:hypothetical protein
MSRAERGPDFIFLIPVDPVHPRRIIRRVLRRELFQRLGIIFGFFATGMNRMNGDEKKDKNKFC